MNSVLSPDEFNKRFFNIKFGKDYILKTNKAHEEYSRLYDLYIFYTDTYSKDIKENKYSYIFINNNKLKDISDQLKQIRISQSKLYSQQDTHYKILQNSANS